MTRTKRFTFIKSLPLPIYQRQICNEIPNILGLHW